MNRDDETRVSEYTAGECPDASWVVGDTIRRIADVAQSFRRPESSLLSADDIVVLLFLFSAAVP